MRRTTLCPLSFVHAFVGGLFAALLITSLAFFHAGKVKPLVTAINTAGEAWSSHFSVLSGCIALALLIFGASGIASFVCGLRTQREVRGRMRTLISALWTTPWLLVGASSLLLLVNAVSESSSNHLLFSYRIEEFLTVMPEAQANFAYFGSIASFVGLGLSILIQLSHWSLIALRFRRVFWLLVDVGLAVGAIASLILFDAVPNDKSQLVGASVRLIFISLASLRGVIRLLPIILEALPFFETKIAWGQLRSSKSSFLATIGSLSVLAVSLSCAMLVVVLSVMGGFRQDLKTKILGNHAHIIIDQPEGEFHDWRQTLETTRDQEHILGATPFVEGDIMFTSAASAFAGVMRGVDLESMDSVNSLRTKVEKGSFDYLLRPEELATYSKGLFDDEKNNDKELPGILLGKELAATLKVFVGDKITTIAPHGTLGPSGIIPKTREYRVAGVIYTGLYEFDMKYAFVLLPQAQSFLRFGDAVSGLEVKVEQLEQVRADADALRGTFKNKRIRDWKELNQNLFGALEIEKLAMFITLGLAVLIAGFCVFGTITLMIQEKTGEIGILSALGSSPAHISRIYKLQGVLVGLLGSGSGLALGYLVAFVAKYFGIPIKQEVYYIKELPVHIDPAEFAMVGIAALLICIASTIIPATLASRMSPVDALRHKG